MTAGHKNSDSYFSHLLGRHAYLFVRTSLQGQVSRLCRAEVVDAHVESVSRLGAGNGNLLHKGAGKLT